MKKYFTKSLWLIIAALLVVSCSKEDGVMDSSSRSDKLEVSFNFFEKSVSEIESRAGTADVAQAASPWITRADTDGKKNLSECKQITELEVALFPEGKDTMYLVTQFSTDKNFGQVKLYVPRGNYKMVAIAAATDNPSKDNKVSIKSKTEVVFPKNEATDMFYTYQDIAVKDREERQNYDCILKRGVTVLQLDSRSEVRPDYIKSFKCMITGNCGNVFNPSTGYCLEKTTLTKTYDISGDRFKAKRFLFTIYFFLGADDVTDITLATQSTDTEDKVAKDLSFKNVHMVKGKMTIYKGPFLSTHSAVSFTIDSPTIPDSGFSTEFE
ncbi:FimB/Mfa2 family fimbrial subunit [Segatella copri]|nr:FimB/Mfa2 family fimbrial subunit [Segatella copri]